MNSDDLTTFLAGARGFGRLKTRQFSIPDNIINTDDEIRSSSAGFGGTFHTLHVIVRVTGAKRV